MTNNTTAELMPEFEDWFEENCTFADFTMRNQHYDDLLTYWAFASYKQGRSAAHGEPSKAGSAEQVSEREAFESWVETRPGHPFAGQFLNLMWAAWQARAAIQSAPERKGSGILKILGDWQSNFVCRTEQKEPERKSLSDAQLDYIARSYFANKRDQESVKHAILEAFKEAQASAQSTDHIGDANEMVRSFNSWTPKQSPDAGSGK